MPLLHWSALSDLTVILGDDIDVSEPESQLPSDISLSIIRMNGNSGLSEVYWMITNADGKRRNIVHTHKWMLFSDYVQSRRKL